jgi:hypothetical protein
MFLEEVLPALHHASQTPLTYREHELVFFQVLHCLKAKIGFNAALDEDLFKEADKKRLGVEKANNWGDFHRVVRAKWGERDLPDQPERSLREIAAHIKHISRTGVYLSKGSKLQDAIMILAYVSTLFHYKGVPLSQPFGDGVCGCAGHAATGCRDCLCTGMNDAANGECDFCEGDRMAICQACLDTQMRY